MITPKDIETKEFTSTKGGGYKGDEVDQFLDEILVDYTRLLEERNALKNKVNLLTEKLNAIATAPAPAPAPEPAPAPAPEPVPAPAPVIIPQVPSEELEAARKKAQRMVADAEEYAKKLIETAQYEANRQNSITKKLTGEIEAFKNSLMDTYSAHIKMIESIPNMEFEDVKIGSETLDILNQSFNDAPVVPVAPAVEEPVAEAPAFEIPVAEPVAPAVPEAAPVVTYNEELFEASSQRTAEKMSSRGLEDLFDEEEMSRKKKEPKKKKKLFFRDEDDDDDDFFDDDDE